MLGEKMRRRRTEAVLVFRWTLLTYTVAQTSFTCHATGQSCFTFSRQAARLTSSTQGSNQGKADAGNGPPWCYGSFLIWRVCLWGSSPMIPPVACYFYWGWFSHLLKHDLLLYHCAHLITGNTVCYYLQLWVRSVHIFTSQQTKNVSIVLFSNLENGPFSSYNPLELAKNKNWATTWWTFKTYINQRSLS